MSPSSPWIGVSSGWWHTLHWPSRPVITPSTLVYLCDPFLCVGFTRRAGMLLAPQLCGVVQVELVSCRTVAHYSRVILIRLQIDIFSCCLHLKHGCAIFVPLLYQTACFLSTACLCLKSDYVERAIYSRPPAVSIARPDYPPSVNRLALSLQVLCNIIALCQSSCCVASSVMPCSCYMSRR